MIPIGSTALITGASSGIGEQFARQLAARGVNLVLVARREERLQAIANDLAQAHPEMSSTVMVADLSSGEAPERLVRELEKSQITVDLLINNAGVGSLTRFVDEDLDAALRQIQLNCMSLVSLTGHLLPTMVARGRGGVINVASSAAFQPIPTMAVYAASKAFVLSFSEALWAETRTSGVRVLALCPGPTETQFFATASKEKQFLTRGRQTPEQVATFALRAYESGRGPSAIPGLANRFLANGHRFFPRRRWSRWQPATSDRCSAPKALPMLNPATNFARCLHARVADEHATPVAPGRCPESAAIAPQCRPWDNLGRAAAVGPDAAAVLGACLEGREGGTRPRTDERPPPRQMRAPRPRASESGRRDTADSLDVRRYRIVAISIARTEAVKGTRAIADGWRAFRA